MKVLTLTKNTRVQFTGDSESNKFTNLFLKLGEGKLEDTNGKIEIATDLYHLIKYIQSSTDTIYPEIQNIKGKHVSWFREMAILRQRNDTTSEINDLLLNKFDGICKKYVNRQDGRN